MPPVGLGTLATNERNLEESCLETSEARNIARVRVDVTGMIQPLCYPGIVKT